VERVAFAAPALTGEEGAGVHDVAFGVRLRGEGWHARRDAEIQ
jgi:hypothetical protein